MTTALRLGGALANCGREVGTDDFLQILADNAPELELYRLIPRSGIKAALDWQAILTTVASAYTIGSAVWEAYERLVKPRLERDPDFAGFVIVTVRGAGRDSAQFVINREYESREAFLDDFTRQVGMLRLSDDGPSDDELRWEFSENGDWIPFRTGRGGRS